MQYKTLLCLLLLLIMKGLTISAQGCGNMNIKLRAEIPSTCNNMVITMMHDQLGRPYLYVAGKEAGLKIYRINSPDSLLLVKTIPTSSYNGLEVMNLTQSGNYLFLAIGNHFNNNQNSGMAIIDVSNPAAAFATDSYFINATGGAGVVKVEGNYAYLGAMGNGLLILDVTDKSNIVFKSQFKPDINYPTPNPNTSLYNARGMEVKDGIVYLCFDAGGLRIINTADKSKPFETGRFSNPVMNGKARAYNNIVLDDTLVYIAVDYCGVEVLNVKDTSGIQLTGWWNPYNCPNNNWFTSAVHANELQYNKSCKTLFLSTGKSDMIVLDMQNPSKPDSCSGYGGNGNNIGTWGIGLYQDQVYLSYICTIGIPFTSGWTGVKVLTYTPCFTGKIEDENLSGMQVYPNPAFNLLTIQLPDVNVWTDYSAFTVRDLSGKIVVPLSMEKVPEGLAMDISNLKPGMYFVSLNGKQRVMNFKFVRLGF